MKRRVVLQMFVMAGLGSAEEDSLGEPNRQRFTVMVRPSPDGSKDQQVGGFSTDAWNGLWDELGVTRKEWQDWNAKTQSSYGYYPIVSEFPELSRLAFIDEGVVHFKAEHVHSEAALLLKKLRWPDTRELAKTMLLAAEIALTLPGADIITHPFGSSPEESSTVTLLAD